MRNEAGEPEEHCNGFDGQDRKRMRSSREITRRESKERNDEECGPNPDKDQEVDAVRRAVKIIGVEP